MRAWPSALDCAHHAGLVHRDVKPGNILITPDGRVLLTDFGIAKGLAGTADDDLTSPNVMMGTAKYLSPEQVRGRKLDGRADLYSLGLVLYECLAGRVPFLGETDADTALARLNRDPTDLTRLRPTLPYGLAPLIHRLLARKPDERYATGAEVRAELQRIAAQPRNDHRPQPRHPAHHAAPRRGHRAAPRTVAQSPTPTGGAAHAAAAPGSRAPPVAAGAEGSADPPGRRARADRTPPAPVGPRQQPNRKFEQRTGPSMILVGAAPGRARRRPGAVGHHGHRRRLVGQSRHHRSPATAAAGTDAATAAPARRRQHPSVRSFDPDGDDGTENDDQAGLAIDGNPATAWQTVCYCDRYLGGKRGVGLVADLGAHRTGTLTVDLGSAPVPVAGLRRRRRRGAHRFAAWGTPIDTSTAPRRRRSASADPTPATTCWCRSSSSARTTTAHKNPFRGSIREFDVRR